MKLLSILALAALTASSAPPPTKFEGKLLDVARLEQFFQVASALSRYPLPKERPQVVLIENRFFLTQGIDDCEGRTGCFIAGMYDIDPKKPDVIFLNSATPARLIAPTLVHEVVHWLQEKNGRTADTCWQVTAAEMEAYAVDYQFTALFTDEKPVLDLPDLTCP